MAANVDRNETDICAPEALVGWRAWYRDDRVFDGETLDDWRALPETGLLYVVLEGTDRRAEIWNYDWVWWDGGLIWRGLVSHHGAGIWRPRPDAQDAELKRGEHVLSDEWLRVRAVAKAWPGKHEGNRMKVKAKLGQIVMFDREFMEKPAVFKNGEADVPESVGKELCKRYPESFGAAGTKAKKER